MNESPSGAARPAAACPVCRVRKEKAWHLVCPECWAKVAPAAQHRLYSLYKNKRGSEEHRIACMTIMQDLYREKRTNETQQRTGEQS